jgi:hypothetical protein
MLFALASTGFAHAQVGVSASVGTTGAGLHLSVPVAEKFNLRFGINGLSRSADGNTDDVDYDYKLKMSTVDALVDYFPMNGAFRISGVQRQQERSQRPSRRRHLHAQWPGLSGNRRRQSERPGRVPQGCVVSRPGLGQCSSKGQGLGLYQRCRRAVPRLARDHAVEPRLHGLGCDLRTDRQRCYG